MKQILNFVPLVLFLLGLIFITLASFLFNEIVGFLVLGISLIVLAVLVGINKGGGQS
ncbi:hypothetical protein PT285_11135 [Lactobacillus sp. ESL0791]|uniref:hypothetical protein n=1 Tax=Lactobacillus sp. ESL0791 TaxID=2983234 RepID=UPI0023F9D4ED|nr:hypothetical protein [Lactobacillus sp. ESL0791]MDF7639955.1 hypothetical protein [Lactobacillus sp. ESL0791]